MSLYLDRCQKIFYFHLPVAVVQKLKEERKNRSQKWKRDPTNIKSLYARRARFAEEKPSKPSELYFVHEYM